MGYKYKTIDKRKAESPFLILEKNIYQNLNVGSLAKVVDTYTGGCKLQIIPKGTMIDSYYSLGELSLTRGDLVLVLFLDNYGTDPLDSVTSTIMHDYQNAVILGKVNKL